MGDGHLASGGELLVDVLAAQGVDRIFCVPGESYLAVLDALHGRDIEIVNARHEGGAAFMAEADGKITGRPGIVFVTRGPGATNASCGIHVAQQDHTPMVVFVGQVERGMRGRDAFQEVDYRDLFGGMAKWVCEIDRADRVVELTLRAFRIAMEGRPGPVVVALPEDMLRDRASRPERPIPRVEPTRVSPSAEVMAALGRLLAQAERPMLLLGGGPWTEVGTGAIRAFAERFELPVSVTFRRQGLFDHAHPLYAGELGIGPNPELRARFEAADLVLVVGDRLSETTTQGYELFSVPFPRQTVVHVVPAPDEVGTVYQPDLAIVAAPDLFAAAAAGLPAPNDLAWRGSAAEAHARYLAWSDRPPQMPGDMQMAGLFDALRDLVGERAVIANGAGNYAIWVHRFWRFRDLHAQVAPTSGTMGYGLPAGIAAKLRSPDRPVIVFAGDGCFQMTLAELATAAQAGAPVIVVVIDNGQYGTIRMHQERDYPGRVVGTALSNPDFAAWAVACGGHGERVVETAAFRGALERSLASGRLAVIHVTIDPRALAPGRTLAA